MRARRSVQQPWTEKLALALLAALVVFLCGCTLKESEAESTGSHVTAASTAATQTVSQEIGKIKIDAFNDQATGKDVPSVGGRIIAQLRAEPDSLNVLVPDAQSAQVDGYIYDSLLRQDPETFKWEPSLAERWTEEDVLTRKDKTQIRGMVSEPEGSAGPVTIKTDSGTINVPRQEVQEINRGVSFTFYLRHGVKFHDGKPFTAADVKFTFDTMKNEFVDAAAIRGYYADLKTCEVLNDYTVRLTYSHQYWMARDFAGGFSVLPKHIYDADNLQERDPQAFGKRFNESRENRRPVGTGQYIFESWETGRQIVLKRNPDYWDASRRGHLDEIVFKFISDEVAALQALKNGEIDLIPEVTAEQFEKETNSPDFLQRFVKIEYYTGDLTYIGWNMRHPPFDDQKVRLAMAYGALNRQEFVQKVLYGHGVVVSGGAYYFGPEYDHSIKPYPFDPEKAKQLLLEAGWYDRDGDGLRDKDGKPFRFEMLMPSGREVYRERAAIMKENLRKLGIDMTVRELEWATFLENINDRKFDACSLRWVLPPDDDPYQIWHTSQSNNRGSNHVGFGNAQTDHLIEQTRVTLDDEKRQKLMFELHRILHEQQPYLFLYSTPELGIYSKRFRGVKIYKVYPGFDLSEWYLPAAQVQQPEAISQKADPGELATGLRSARQ